MKDKIYKGQQSFTDTVPKHNLILKIGDKLNNHFARTTQRILGAQPDSTDKLNKLLNSLPDSEDSTFSQQKNKS